MISAFIGVRVTILIFHSSAAPYDTITAGDRIQRAWAELTNLMRETNVNMFDSNRRTEDAVADGSYFGFLEKYNPLLRTFRERFDSTGGKAIPNPILVSR